MHDTYSHNGRIFGAVRLTRPTESEEAALSKFFKRDYHNQALIRIGLGDFERQIQKNFPEEGEGFRLGDFLAEYMGTPKKQLEETLQKGSFASVILSELLPKFDEPPAADWLKELSRQTRREYREWTERYNIEPTPVIEMLQSVSEALNNLPQEKKPTPLAKFSEKFANSPYALDFHEKHGQLFLKALAFKFKQPVPTCTEDCINLHLRAGLLTCGRISSVTMHEIQSGTQILTLENISCLEYISAHGGKVFIFEDPLIFNAVCERLNDCRCTIINPTNGNSAAFLHLLRIFLAAGNTMHYAGNINFKSLEFADKLCVDFGKNLIPWRYSREDYEFILSQKNFILPSEKKHISLHNETLASLLSLMRKTGRTASSMPLIPHYIEDIKNIVHSQNK